MISLLKRRFIQDHTGHTALFHKLEMGNKNFCCNTAGDQIFDRNLGIPKKKGQFFKVVYVFVGGNPVVTFDANDQQILKALEALPCTSHGSFGLISCASSAPFVHYTVHIIILHLPGA